MAKTTQMAEPTKASEPMVTFILSAAAATATEAKHLILSSAAIQIHDEKALSKIWKIAMNMPRTIHIAKETQAVVRTPSFQIKRD